MSGEMKNSEERKGTMEKKMKIEKSRILFWDVLGIVIGRIYIFGINPMAMGYFLSLYAQDTNRPFLAACILLGMSAAGTEGGIVKYGLSMLVTAIVLHLAEHTGKRLTKAMKYAAGSCIGAVMALSGGMLTIEYKTYIILAALEGILIFVFACLFQGLIERWPAAGEEEKETYVRQNIQLLTKNKVQEFSDSLERLSGSFAKMAGERREAGGVDVNEVFEDISSRFCKECKNCQSCWGEDYAFTYEAAQELFLTAQTQGYVASEDVPEAFISRCAYAGAFVEETNSLLREKRESFGFENRLAESREAVAGQLSEMARIMKGFASELYEMKEVRTRLEEEMIERLKKSHIDVQKLIIMERKEKRKEIHLMGRTRMGRCVTAREIAVMLGQVMGKRLKPAKQTKSVLGRDLEVMVFIEDTPYKTLTGVARAIKDGEEVSGDNFSFLSLDDGEEVLLLSDGMGAGDAADRESCLLIELLEHFLEAGFDKEAAIRMINSTYVLQSDSSSFSTIDLGSIDLYTGEAEFLKLGGAASFIKRKNSVECISAETLPAGMFEEIELVRQKAVLSDGDYIVMVTDGIMDCFEGDNKEEQVAFLLEETTSVNPREIASYVLNGALEMSKNKNMDDMTVLVAGLWEKA